ncbi:1197_t:CDS:1, partial [Racocetra persica]
QLSSVNGSENDDYNASLLDVESNFGGKRSDGIEICVTEFTEVTSEHEDDSNNQFKIPRIQSDLKLKSRQDEKTIMNPNLEITSNNITVPVLVISKADDGLDSGEKTSASDDLSDYFVDAEEWS